MDAARSMVNGIDGTDGTISEFKWSEFFRALCHSRQTFVKNFCFFANNFAVLIELVFRTQESEPLIKKMYPSQV